MPLVTSLVLFPSLLALSAAVASSVPYTLSGRLWAAYLRQLNTRPLRTKMITSGTLFLFGDTVTQFGIEGRRVGGSSESASGEDRVQSYDPMRAARMATYGGFIFAPLGHTWLTAVDKIRFPQSKLKTLGAKLFLDQCVWGPFIVSMFWGSNGLMEGRTPEEVKTKVEMQFVKSYMTSVCVFGPTQIVNFTLIPLQHRLAVQQAVGLGWNIFLSYANNLNNKRLAEAKAALARAQSAHAEEDTAESAAAERALEVKVEKAQARKDRMRDAQGGGATGVGTRMGW